MVLYPAKLLLSLPMLLHWTLSPIILNVIYALYATWTCVSVCVYVCAYSSLPHVFPASGLALSPASWSALWPCDVMARSVLEWASRRCSPARECSCQTSFSFVDEACFLFFSVSSEPVRLGFSVSSLQNGRELNRFHPLCFLPKGDGCLIVLCSSSSTQRSTFSSLVTFSTFFRHFSQ